MLRSMTPLLRLPAVEPCPNCDAGPVRHESGQGRMYPLGHSEMVVLDLPWEIPVCRSCAGVSTTPEGDTLLLRALRASLWRELVRTEEGLSRVHEHLGLLAGAISDPRGEIPSSLSPAQRLWWRVFRDWGQWNEIPREVLVSGSGGLVEWTVGRIRAAIESVGTDGIAPAPVALPSGLEMGSL